MNPIEALKPFKLIMGSSSVERRHVATEMGFDFTTVADAIISKLQLLIENSQEIDGKQTLLLAADTIEEGLVPNVAGGLTTEHPLIQPCVKAVIGGSKALAERLVKDVL